MGQSKPGTFFVLGNPLVPQDSAPLRVLPKLREKFPELNFVEWDPAEELPSQKTLNIIDTVLGIQRVQLIQDIESIVTGKVYSLHDFDLGFNLKLLKKAKKLDGANIIGIPAHFDDDTALREVSKAIRKHFSNAVRKKKTLAFFSPSQSQ